MTMSRVLRRTCSSICFLKMSRNILIKSRQLKEILQVASFRGCFFGVDYLIEPSKKPLAYKTNGFQQFISSSLGQNNG